MVKDLPDDVISTEAVPVLEQRLTDADTARPEAVSLNLRTHPALFTFVFAIPDTVTV